MMKKLLAHRQLMKMLLVEAQIDESSGDDDVVATAEIVTRKCRHHRYTMKLLLLHQVR